MKLKAIILAAGTGTRMKSKMPKVLHKVCGQTMLGHVIDVSKDSKAEECIVVVGHGAEEVQKTLPEGVKTVLQAEQLGTGHAVMVAEEHIETQGTVLVLYGDGPLITEETLNALMTYHQEGKYSATVLTAELENPTGYGRIIRDDDDRLKTIVEEKDTTVGEKEVREINSGIYCFDSKVLKETLPKIQNNNSQKEYYLTDALTIIKQEGLKVGVYQIENYEDIMAVNSREQLAEVEEVMQRRIVKKHMEAGVTFIDPQSTYIEKTVKVGMDTILHPGVILKGATEIGEDCIIGHNSRIENSILKNGIEVQSSTIIESTIDDHATIGPYAYLRPQSHIGKHVKVGDFVEVKNATIDDHSKAAHLAYIGDAEIGKHVNIGCGVIFVNYDGIKKHKTIIKDHAFVGSNSNLVAPITIQESAFVASGSTITREVPAGALAVGRSRQENKEGWVARKGVGKK
ncbi:UDP-N-acetylglucosamine pyrophosphorylase [Alkaliphilus metalliredigens QYMF]|uniref:Bifunctional protein GlmU n=1 Tax=Alkaliphilus metalliredigens (strain QYMF) TaxID=293826 RepID=GLMU_ALKMQ|nr:bifunctional UDP-N-acetylglucosamine diphosphorylase/glucosamine-1-phosphate N-acetyltransferase GlmU [Alkaliphilus metalliredigens]A6TJM5.1 RecName: Full=Bifunctional protein GlmU; Includes: RecName: Full=UDP-N-acetylglucosamine pyrophosphorylase; AltName: Full=N-acetylglucosamine-1-phosphate uridyltransferase; Includes: RecName: Full=Glucosamine-1-phosphate N-acetyltransferase [Alkaliphilus metalliredigens QYMF]ABR46393.1 UDP-N-acetylglucosamine pyrophosphorylase [Alkaliphilus metalliredigen